MKVERSKVKIKRGTHGTPKSVAIRNCPEHDYSLTYRPAELAWVCPAEGCTYVEYPDTELGAKPIVGKPPLMVLFIDGQVWLKAENNVMFNITEISAVRFDRYANRPEYVEVKLALPYAEMKEVGS